jgi:hypothetical protein
VSPYEAWSDTATPDAPIAGTVGLDGVAGAFADLAHPKRHATVMVDPWS